MKPLWIRNPAQAFNKWLATQEEESPRVDINDLRIRELSFSNRDGWISLMSYLHSRRSACIREAEQSTERRAENLGASRELEIIITTLSALSSEASEE